MVSAARDVLAVTASLGRYWVTIRPQVSPLVRQFERWAADIPDPILRAQASSTLREEVLNAEGVAVFSTLVPRDYLACTTRLIVTLQTICDYVDTIGEEPCDDPLRNGLQHHLALTAALQPDAPPVDYYRYHPQGEDGGYLERLVDVCRECVVTLPSIEPVLPMALRAAQRCGEAQAQTHAAIHQGTDELAAWSLRQDRADGYLWWELAAGGISSLSLYALLAAAADPDTTAADAAQIDATYFPSVCAFSALLDSLVDYDSDSGVASHSSIGHYPTNQVAAERMASIAREAETRARGLRRGRRHAAILAGLAGFYLSSPNADTAFAGPIKARITESLGPMLPPILATMRVRRTGISGARSRGRRRRTPSPPPRS